MSRTSIGLNHVKVGLTGGESERSEAKSYYSVGSSAEAYNLMMAAKTPSENPLNRSGLALRQHAIHPPIQTVAHASTVLTGYLCSACYPRAKPLNAFPEKVGFTVTPWDWIRDLPVGQIRPCLRQILQSDDVQGRLMGHSDSKIEYKSSREADVRHVELGNSGRCCSVEREL